MDFWSQLNQETKIIVFTAIAVIAVGYLLYMVRRIRYASDTRKARSSLHKAMKDMEKARQLVQAEASKILATSSTSQIAGYEIVRQIETVFADGHKSPSEAVDAIKAAAAMKGGNAIINLASDRLPTGKCSARGDAVIVKPAQVQ